MIITEDKRNQLVAKSKNSSNGGLQRFKRRLKSRVATSTQQYNRLDMNQLFKDDILSISIEVNGETDNYLVKISYGGFLNALRDELRRFETERIELRNIIKALVISFNKSDVFIRCSCPDFKYRFAYWATVDGLNSGEPELRPSDETNPDNDKGPACKHILLVLSNTSWLIKVASVINNYIKYMERYRKTQYDSIIYPAIYGKKRDVQMSMFDDEENVEDNTSEINTQGSKLGRGRKQIANPSIRKARERREKPIDGQETLFDDEENETENEE